MLALVPAALPVGLTKTATRKDPPQYRLSGKMLAGILSLVSKV